MHDQKKELTRTFEDPATFIQLLKQMACKALALAQQCKAKGYHIANYQAKDARDFDVCFTYLSENFNRMALNFDAYWTGKMKFPIPSEGFQNFTDPFN